MLDLPAIRHHLHQNPELSGKEQYTQAYLREQLAALPGVQVRTVGGTGLLAILQGAAPGTGLLLRADIDALPITEDMPGLAYQSQNPGVAHKCGHDGHATSLLGAVAEVAQHSRVKQGCLYALFQPAEETGQGATQVLNDSAFPAADIQKAFAYHNVPKAPVGQLLFKEGTFSAGVISVAIRFYGKNTHAAEPEGGINPSGAISALLQQAAHMENRAAEDADFDLLTPIFGRFGEKAYGTAAGEGEVHFTLRCWNAKRLDALKNQLAKVVERLAAQEGLTHDLTWFEEFRPTQNTAKARIQEAGERLQLDLRELQAPFKWGEDFGLFTERYEGGMYGLGSGTEQVALHHPDFDYPDDLLNHARAMFVQLVEMELGNG